MEHGLRLPWWEFRPADLALPGTVVPPDSRQEEGLLAGFLQAGARAETADCFVSGVLCVALTLPDRFYRIVAALLSRRGRAMGTREWYIPHSNIAKRRYFVHHPLQILTLGWTESEFEFAYLR